MEQHYNDLLKKLKSRSDIDPNREFSSELRQKLIKRQHNTTNSSSLATILTIPVTLSVFVFLVMVTTGQSIGLKHAAQLISDKEKYLETTMCIVLMFCLSLFISFIYFKGFTKGRLVYLTFSLSFIAWVGNLIYAEHDHKEDSIEQSGYNETFDNEIVNPLMMKQDQQQDGEEEGQ
ncbi:hypothetical protein [Lysinibacillus cavernae]|uniref:hypothetical protein n=1 Tax=Lysinibacillus cavernae TaxID=2666135 RepID=UPI0012D91D9E|nr:hypothetical protein [Lysinibacillus cavernae]